MKFKILFVLFIWSCIVKSQNSFFSYDGKEMRDRIIKIYEQTRSSKEAKSLSEDIYKFYDNLPNENSKKDFIDLMNKMREQKIYSYNNYRNFANTLNKIKNIVDKDNIHVWLSNYLKMFNDKNNHNYQWMFDNNNSIVDNSIISKDKLIEWNFTKSTKIKFIDDTIQRFKIENGEIYCRYNKNEYLYIKKLEGVYDLENLKLYIHEAKVDWIRMGKKSEELFVEIYNDTIDLNRNNYEVENAYLTSVYLGVSKMKGKLKHRVFNKNSRENSIVFTSDSEFGYSHISGEYDYKGNLKVNGINYNLIRDHLNNIRASLSIRRNKNILYSIEGDFFNIEENKVTSSNVYLKINMLDSTVINGASVNMIFDYKNRVLFFERSLDKEGRSLINNSYHRLGVFGSKIYWHMDSSWVYVTSTNDNIIMLSDNYYEESIHKRFRGLNKINPLEKIDNLLKVNKDKREYTFEEISKELNVKKNDLYWIFLELSNIGYASADISNERITFFDKFLDLEKLKQNVIDFDNMYFEGNAEDKVVFKINLDNGKMISAKANRVNISSDQNVSIFPYKGKSEIRKNREIFLEGGSFTIGGYNIWGENIDFDYEDYSFTMTGNQTASIDIPSITPGKNNSYEMKNIINRIDSIQGKIWINNPKNKSNKKDSIQYPKFMLSKTAYLFYDNPVFMKGNYVRDRFYIKVHPFQKDSIISNATYKKIYFDATVHTEIFPEFEERIKVQKDYTFGFVRKTPEEGFSVYGDRGRFKNILALSSRGLKGVGRFTFSASESESEDIEFYLDSLKAKTKKFEIKETVNENIDVPSVVHDFVELKWDVKKDTMFLKSKMPFNLYNRLVKNDGIMKLTSNSLIGGGQASIRNGRIKSKIFNFKSKNFFSNHMDFALRENSKSEYEFFIEDAYGNIDIANQKGEFRLNKDSARIEIMPIKFRAFVKNAFWDMNDASVLMKEEGDSLSWIESISPEGEGLKFEAGKALYSLRTKTLISENVETIEVGDARIYPIEKTITIQKGGKIKKIEKALVNIIGINKSDSVVHKFKDSEIVINSGKKYSGKGNYIYQDKEGNTYDINFNKIYSNDSTKNFSKGEGVVTKKQNFKIAPKFSFFGNVFMEPRIKRIKFHGNILLDTLNCYKNIRIGNNIFINSYVDINNTVLNLEMKNSKKDTIFLNSGISYKEEKTFRGFFLNDRNLDKDENIYIINRADKVSYDDKNSCYVTESKKGYKSYFYDVECKLGMEGEIKFHNMGKVLEMEGFADLEQDLKDKKIKYNDFTYSLNFDFDEDILDEIRKEFAYNDTTYINDTVFNKNQIFDTIKEKISDKYYNSKLKMERDTIMIKEKIVTKYKIDTVVNNEINISEINQSIEGNNKTYGFFLKKYIPDNIKAKGKIQGINNIEDEIERDFVLNDMKLTWNDETKCFYSEKDKIDILQINKKLFGKRLKGKFEIQRDRISDIITIYFEHPYKGHYYFFRFSKNRVNFFTDNKEIMSKFDELREKGKDVKVLDSGEEYELRTPNQIVIKAFLTKYY